MSYRFIQRSFLHCKECCFLLFDYKGDNSSDLDETRNSQLENTVLQSRIKILPKSTRRENCGEVTQSTCNTKPGNNPLQ